MLEVTDEFCPWNTGRYQVDGSPQGSSCHRTDAQADLTLSAATLGSLYLGGLAPGPLAKAGLVDELAPHALTRATTMFTGTEAPHTACGF